jgi:sodium/hydrogen antiporter
MESENYFTLVGFLLLAMALSQGLLRKLPITSSIIYLGFGLAIGHHGFDLVKLDVLKNSVLIEVLSEITVIIALFTVGLKLRLPLKDKRWFLPVSLATISMVVTIFLIALVSFYFLDLSFGQSILLGAVLAPTDPVLASEVQLPRPKVDDPLKFALTTEGGLNDGTAFPFVMLGLGLMGSEGTDWTFLKWFSVDLVWAVIGGLLIGGLSGLIISRLANFVRHESKSDYLEDFLTIASIAISYGLAIQFKAYGFLAVFANALMIRQVELKEVGIFRRLFKRELPDDVLSFNEQLERIFEVVSVVLVGLLIDLRTFSFETLLFVLVLFLIIRPLGVVTGTLASDLTWKEKSFLSWFGVRGIGSIYYLFFAINHDQVKQNEFPLIEITLWTLFASIILHGLTSKHMKRMKLI